MERTAKGRTKKIESKRMERQEERVSARELNEI